MILLLLGGDYLHMHLRGKQSIYRYHGQYTMEQFLRTQADEFMNERVVTKMKELF